MSMLALTYLATQYQLALHRARFLVVLALGGLAQPLIMIAVGPKLTELALALLAQHVVLATAMLALDLRKPAQDYAEAEEPTAAGVSEALPPTPTVV